MHLDVEAIMDKRNKDPAIVGACAGAAGGLYTAYRLEKPAQDHYEAMQDLRHEIGELKHAGRLAIEKHEQPKTVRHTEQQIARNETKLGAMEQTTPKDIDGGIAALGLPLAGAVAGAFLVAAACTRVRNVRTGH